MTVSVFFLGIFLKGGPGLFRIKQHKFFETKGLKIQDLDKLKDRLYTFMRNDLLADVEVSER